MVRLLIVSDIHYACDAEKARRGHEARAASSRLQRFVAHIWRHYFWMRDPLAHNHRLDWILESQPGPDWAIVNGDYTVDTAFVGVSDDASFESAKMCLDRLRAQYGHRLLCTIGDHDLGKKSLFGGVGGPRYRSLERMEEELGVPRIWRMEIGRYLLIGLASTVAAVPLFEHEIPSEELALWNRAQSRMMAELRHCFETARKDQRILLFVHDPSSLAWLYREEFIRAGLDRVERTIVGHLHSPAILRASRILQGMPRINWMGHTARRYSAALNKARCWKRFRVLLCPSPHGMQILKDGGYFTAVLSPDAEQPVRFQRHPVPWP